MRDLPTIPVTLQIAYQFSNYSIKREVLALTIRSLLHRPPTSTLSMQDVKHSPEGVESIDSELDEPMSDEEDNCGNEQYEDFSPRRPNTSLGHSITSTWRDSNGMNHCPDDIMPSIQSEYAELPEDKLLQIGGQMSPHSASTKFATPAPPPHLYGVFKECHSYQQSGTSGRSPSVGTCVSDFGATSIPSIDRPKRMMNFTGVPAERESSRGIVSNERPYSSMSSMCPPPPFLKTKKSSLMKGKGIFNKILGVGTPKSKDMHPVQPTGVGWQEARRDLNRSNSPSLEEREEKRRNTKLEGFKVLEPVEVLGQVQGDENENGGVVMSSSRLNIEKLNFSLVDKTTRCIVTWPSNSTPESLATGVVCRPYRNDIQRLRAIFVFLAEKISWEKGMPDLRGDDFVCLRVLESRRASCGELAIVLQAMCESIDIPCEIIHGYIKTPGEAVDIGSRLDTNHTWNAVLIEGEWRIIDVSLANPTHPHHQQFSNIAVAEPFFFLTRPLNAHIVPPLSQEIVISLPYVGPAYFQCNIRLINFDTSMLRLKGFECIQIDLQVPEDIECVAETEARAITTDSEGDMFNNSDFEKKPGLSQAMWVDNMKVFRIKGVLPGNQVRGVLYVYAGKKGLMHSINDNPHSLALAIHIVHTGENAPYSFVPRHPTLYAMRHDLYIRQPQCELLRLNNTYVFSIRQYPSSRNSTSKPVKLALQSPSGTLTKFQPDHGKRTWDIQSKVVETGIFRALVLSERRSYCAFAEWKCIA
ncbi:cytokinesis protein 3 [Neolecta irregularis DAH-3]|uniref:Cytokinesis protein 3 n=1 Tax=Neolecta irregularis (strain DAH-3) TaxID=1198029 RepID=A0A1U7LLW6_NEOID|nr:cytokinesis protein 3 [Neolecta irregularis DAH-3]|eukprot:OLL23654.1 cytokinesis protein 3 [Neolecta irregularis DAH-3]